MPQDGSMNQRALTKERCQDYFVNLVPGASAGKCNGFGRITCNGSGFHPHHLVDYLYAED